MAIYDDKSGITILDSQVPFVTGNLPPKLEKQYMNPIRYCTNYRIVPAYILFAAVCIGLGLLLMKIDEHRFLPVFIGLFVLLGIVSVCLVLSVPKTRKKELTLELERYDFDASSVPKQDRYMIAYEGSELVFSSEGMMVDGTFYWYNHLKPGLVTSNRFNRVWVAVMFGEDPIKSLFVPISPVVIRAIEDFSIPLQNREAFDYLMEHKENAFAQIYNHGNFRIFAYE